MIAIYDTEIFYNMFLYVDKDWKTGELSIFEISERKDDSVKLEKHIKSLDRMIGYNNLSYDYPLLHYWLNTGFFDWIDTTTRMKEFSDKLIQSTQPKFNRIYNPIVEQIDLFSVWHYDNKARICGLKKLQISMNWWNVEDSSEDFDENVEDYDAVIRYCINDVESTYEFANRSLNAIRERQKIKKNENINCLNYSDSKLGEQIILKEYCEITMTSVNEIKSQCEHIPEIKLKHIIFDWIKFETKQFQDILTSLKSKTIRNGENIGFEFYFDGVKITVAEGGIHGSKHGVFSSSKKRVVLDSDVSSLYPAIIVENKIAPKHLNVEFVNIIKNHYENRLKIKQKLKDKSLGLNEKELLEYESERLKKSINSVYGKFGDRFSPLYGNDAVYRVTINGQILVLKWLELLSEVPTIEFIQINTDGVVVEFDRQYENLYYEQCKKFTDLTNFLLEWVTYDKICIANVNNYVSLSNTGKIKTKGEFVYEVGNDYHKRLNFAVSRKAAVDRLLYGKSIEDSVTSEQDVFKFIGSVRFKKNKKVDPEDVEHEGSKGVLYDKVGKFKELPPNVRFVFSKQGGVIRKIYEDGRSSILFDNKAIINANKIEDSRKKELMSQINVKHYIFLAQKLVNSVATGKVVKGKHKDQLTIF